jgi:hypothetical protein
MRGARSLLGEPYTRQLDGKLRELWFRLKRRAVGVTYWIATRAADRVVDSVREGADA